MNTSTFTSQWHTRIHTYMMIIISTRTTIRPDDPNCILTNMFGFGIRPRTFQISTTPTGIAVVAVVNIQTQREGQK